MSKSGLNYATIFNDIAHGLALRFDFDFYLDKIKNHRDVPKLALTNKLSMWIYYKNNPHKFEINLTHTTDELRQYQSEISQLLKSGKVPEQFDSEYYLSVYPDVAEYKVQFPLPCFHHWLCFGIFEHRRFRYHDKPQKTLAIEGLSSAIKTTKIGSGKVSAVGSLQGKVSAIRPSQEKSPEVNSSFQGKLSPITQESQYLLLQDVIQVTLSRYIGNKIYKRNLTTQLVDYFRQSVSQSAETHDFFHWSREQMSEFMTDFFKLINLKGYLNHISAGASMESVLLLFTHKLNGIRERFEIMLAKQCGHTVTTCPMCQSITHETSSSPPEDFITLLKKAQEKSIEETILSLKQYQEMKVDQTFATFKHLHQSSMQEMTESIKKLVPVEKSQAGQGTNFWDEFGKIQEASTQQILSLLSQNLTELKDLNTLQANVFLSKFNELVPTTTASQLTEEIKATVDEPKIIAKDGELISSANGELITSAKGELLPLKTTLQLVPRKILPRQLSPHETFPTHGLNEADLDQIVKVWRNFYSRVTEQMPVAELNILDNIEVLFDLDHNRVQAMAKLLGLYCDDFSQLVSNCELDLLGIKAHYESIRLIKVSIEERQQVSVEDIHEIESQLFDQQSQLIGLQAQIDSIEAFTVSEFLDDLIICLQESIYNLMDRHGRGGKLNEKLIGMIQKVVLDKCKKMDMEGQQFTIDNYQLMADQFSTYYHEQVEGGWLVPAVMDSFQVHQHLDNFVDSLINPTHSFVPQREDSFVPQREDSFVPQREDSFVSQREDSFVSQREDSKFE